MAHQRLTPSQEYSGLTKAQRDNTSTSGLMYKQKNQHKYVDREITPELLVGTFSALGAQNGPWEGCAKSVVVPMTYSRTKIESAVQSLIAYGGTNIAEGMAWGLRAVSTGAPFTKVEGSGSIPPALIADPNNEADKKWNKVMVMVTDGDNAVGSDSLNGTNYSSYGFSATPLALNRFGTTNANAALGVMNSDMNSACTQVKNSKVELYVISYGSGVSDATKAVLGACATDAAHYMHANTTAALKTSLDHVGLNTLNKRLYVSK